MATLREYLAEGPFTLSMSCSFFGHFAHSGGLQALIDAGLRPAKVTGSSAGAVVAATYAAGYEPDEMYQLFDELHFGDIFSFWPSLQWGTADGWLSPGFGVFRQNIDALEAKLLPSPGSGAPDAAPKDAPDGPSETPSSDGSSPRTWPRRLEQCRVPVALSVYDATDNELRVLDHGRICEAVAASAAVPHLMHGVLPREMDASARAGNAASSLDHLVGHRLIDGGVGGDMLGTAGAGPDERVLNINMFLRMFVPELPDDIPGCVTVDVWGVPFVTPMSMKTNGPIARDATYQAVKRALDMHLPLDRGVARRFAVDATPAKQPSLDKSLNGTSSEDRPLRYESKKRTSAEQQPARWYQLWRPTPPGDSKRRRQAKWYELSAA